MSTGIVIQARTGATRLPNKMILPFYQGKNMLQILIERLKKDVELPIIVATTDKEGDDSIQEIALSEGVGLYRGSEKDVLSRFIGAAHRYNLDNVIRICADNLLLDTRYINVLAHYAEHTNHDYLSFMNFQGKPAILTHYGLWAIELAKVTALERVAALTNDMLYHEHVTNYLYTHPQEFDTHLLEIYSPVQFNLRVRLTVDTQKDFDILSQIYCRLKESGAEITPENILSVIDTMEGVYDEMEKIINANRK